MAAVGDSAPETMTPAPVPTPTPAQNPITTVPTYTATPDTPAMMALPVQTSASGDASTSRKFYTITASLRETYDDNVNTSSSDKQSSLETQLTPSVLVDFPTPQGDFSARYTFYITYYTHGPNTDTNAKDQSSIELSHEFVAQYSHSFSERFNLNLAEQFRYFTEPSLYQGTGTNYQNGNYISNTLNGQFSAQWTPLFGTTTNYSNTVVRYDEAAVAAFQNSVENTGTQSFIFAIYPKISVSAGGIVDDITYDDVERGYSNYTAFFGAQWQALPSLSLSARGGGSYTEPDNGKAFESPYAALSLSWNIGARSQLSFDYAHEVTPSDEINTSGRETDRVSANFSYAITPRLSSHLQGTYNAAQVSTSLISSGSGISAYSENDYYLDTGLTFHYNSFLDVYGGITLSGVSADLAGLDYSRDEVYLGVRGTY